MTLTKKSVVVPVDFSEDSLKAVQTGLEYVSSPSNLHVIHVIRSWGIVDPLVADRIPDQERLEKGREQLAELLSDDRYAKVETKTVIGNPGVEITRYAEEVGAELIVMPSHGRSGLSHLALGSVAERVVRLASCPVLILRS
jgi:nucleotide-binding universal stress UspA family protein